MKRTLPQPSLFRMQNYIHCYQLQRIYYKGSWNTLSNSSPPPTILRLQGASSHPPAILSSIRYTLPTWNFLFSKKRMLWLVESSGKLVGNNLLAIFNCNISVNRYRVCIVCKTGASMKMKRWRCHGMSAPEWCSKEPISAVTRGNTREK